MSHSLLPYGTSVVPLPQESFSSEKQHSFNPYTDNGGTILGISSGDFVIIAGDTRSTSGYSINSRLEPKVFRIGDDDRIVLSVVGFGADGKDLKERLDAMVNMYKFKHGKPITVEACAHRLSTLLYQKRFFPYQVQAILGGLDKDGKGAVFSYDPAGCYERSACRVAGAAANLIMPFLDSQVELNNQYIPSTLAGAELQERPREVFSKDTVIDFVKDAFNNATERHIEVGDGLQMLLVSKDGIKETIVPLKKD
ncbi:putative proteasome component Prs3 [Bisporella sp. PMI_857]|nr:putative proteasome component Prs3 [Bisporella sp. PMI_857]